MDITGKIIWQQAAGDSDRNYAELCLKWDVILNGPGYAGPWPGCKKILLEDEWTSRKVTDLWRFAEEMKDGDIVVLRNGTSTVSGVGQVVGGYEWLDEFGDVDGWDLQHVRRLRWLWKDLSNPKRFDTYALKQGDTTQKLNDGLVKEWIQTLNIENSDFNRPLARLPVNSSANEITISEVSDFLFDQGVASTSISTLLDQIGELSRIAKWYTRTKKLPSEHETVAYLIVPLLRALGWTPQRMAVEWHYVDVALFEQLPRSDENLRVVVEAKRMNNSCLSAMSQAMSYSEGKLSCHRLIVTDGLRYGVYTRKGLEPFQLHAYMNLTRLRGECPMYNCHGAKVALLAMAPEWKPPLLAD